MSGSSTSSMFIFERMKEENVKEVTAMFMQAMAEEDGISEREFENEISVMSFLRTSYPYVLKDKVDEEIMAIFVLRNSPVVRSENSIYCSQYMIVRPNHRRKGISVYLHVVELPKLRKKHGFVASLMRASLLSNVGISGAHSKFSLVGIIPNSIYFSKYGWTDDLIGYSSMEHEAEKKLPIIKERLEIPPLKYAIQNITAVNEEIPFCVEFPPFSHGGQSLFISKPSSEEAFEMEKIIREAANDGEGFALDEFNSDGFMNRRLLHNNQMLVIKTQAGSIKAGLVFGKSKFCRDIKTTQVGGYIIVRKADRGRGLGKVLLSYCLDNMEKLGYTAILTDVFVTNEVMLSMLRKTGFIVTVTVPNSGIIKGKGRTNTYIMYKHKVNIKFAKL